MFLFNREKNGVIRLYCDCIRASSALGQRSDSARDCLAKRDCETWSDAIYQTAGSVGRSKHSAKERSGGSFPRSASNRSTKGTTRSGGIVSRLKGWLVESKYLLTMSTCSVLTRGALGVFGQDFARPWVTRPVPARAESI